MADYGDIGRTTFSPSLSVGLVNASFFVAGVNTRPVIDSSLGVGLEAITSIFWNPGSKCLFTESLCYRGGRFAWATPTTQRFIAITGGTPFANVIVMNSLAFDQMSSFDYQGNLHIPNPDAGEYFIYETGNSGKKWRAVVTASAVTLENLSAVGGYPTIPIGSRILTLQNGKFVAVTPT